MSLFSIWKLSNYDLRQKKKYTIRLFLNLFLIIAPLLVWMVLSESLNHGNDEVIYNTASMNRIMFAYSDLPQEEDDNGEWQYMQALLEMDVAGNYKEYADIDLPFVLEKDNWHFVNLKYVAFSVDGKTYQGVNDYTYDFAIPFRPGELPSVYSVPFYLQVIRSDTFYNQNDIVEYDYRYPDAYPEAMIAGSSHLNANEILISDYLLNKCGIDATNDLIGKNISIIIDGNVLLENYRLAGIIDSRFFRTSDQLNRAQCMVGYSEDICERLGVHTWVSEVALTDYSKSLETVQTLFDLGFVVEPLTVMAFERYDTVSSAQKIIDRIVSVIAAFIVLTLLLNVSYILYQQICQQSSYYGMLIAIGMLWKQLVALHLIQLFELLVVSIGGAIMIAYIAILCMNRLIFTMANLTIGIGGREYLLAGLKALGIVGSVVCLIELYLLLKLRRTEPCQLLTEELH